MPSPSSTIDLTSSSPTLTLAEHKSLTQHYLQQYLHNLHTSYQQSFHQGLSYYQHYEQNTIVALQQQLQNAVQLYNETDFTIKQLKSKYDTQHHLQYDQLLQEYDKLQWKYEDLQLQWQEKLRDEQQHSYDAIKKWQQLQHLRSDFNKSRKTELQLQQQHAATALSHGHSSSTRSRHHSTHSSPKIRSIKNSYTTELEPLPTVTTTDIEQIKVELQLLEQQHCIQIMEISKLEREYNELVKQQSIQHEKYQSELQQELQQQHEIESRHQEQKLEHQQLQTKHQHKVQQLQTAYNALLEQHSKLLTDLQNLVHTKSTVIEDCERLQNETKVVEEQTYEYQHQHVEQMIKGRQLYKDAVYPGIQTIQSALQIVKQSFEMYVTALHQHDQQRSVDNDVVDPLMEAIASRLTVNNQAVIDLERHVHAISDGIQG